MSLNEHRIDYIILLRNITGSCNYDSHEAVCFLKSSRSTFWNIALCSPLNVNRSFGFLLLSVASCFVFS
jgi:hypothetical protein